MQRLILIILIIFSSMSFAQQGDWEKLDKPKYSIEYPSTWELNESGYMNTEFMVLSPFDQTKPNFRPNLNLILQDLTGNEMSLDDYANLSENQIKSLLQGSKIIESKRIKSNELDCHRMLYTASQGEIDLQFIQYYFVENNAAFVLTFTCDEERFNDFKSVGEKILNSFKIK